MEIYDKSEIKFRGVIWTNDENEDENEMEFWELIMGESIWEVYNIEYYSKISEKLIVNNIYYTLLYF